MTPSELLTKMKTPHGEAPMSTPSVPLPPRAQAARAFAVEAHGAQRYGAEPYAVHLDAVVANILRFDPNADADTLAAGFLHDVVEDTPVTLDQVMERFGSRVAELVHAVTAEPGATRKERHQRTWPKVVETEGAVRLKLADRIANVEACWAARSRLLFMYHQEYRQFRGGLYASATGVEQAMWAELDRLMGWG